MLRTALLAHSGALTLVSCLAMESKKDAAVATAACAPQLVDKCDVSASSVRTAERRKHSGRGLEGLLASDSCHISASSVCKAECRKRSVCTVPLEQMPLKPLLHMPRTQRWDLLASRFSGC